VLSRLWPLAALLVAAAIAPLHAHDPGCEEDLLEPCSTEDARGEVFEADDAFLLERGTGRILFRHAPDGQPVRGALLDRKSVV